MSVFRDELANLFPDDDRARYLVENSWLLPDFLASRKRLAWSPEPRLKGSVMVHGHCHQSAFDGLDGTRDLLATLGLDVSTPDNGCCGMAGGFGFEADKYEISNRIGESALFPRVRATAEDAFIVSDGFSCREQIRRGTGRKALHSAELLALALGQGGDA